MTTERSGMSLDATGMMPLAEIRERLWASRGLGGIELGNDEFECILASLDAHLSRDAVVSDSPLSVFNQGTWTYSGTGQSFTKAEMDEAAYVVYRESFAARHAAVPDEMDEFSHPNTEFVYGWNACREAMLTQRDGGG